MRVIRYVLAHVLPYEIARKPDLKEPDPGPFMYMLDKWMDIEAALESGAGAVTAAFPEVQGDTYSEWIVYLGKLTEHQ